MELAPEGPRRGDLADDISAARGQPGRRAVLDTLAQFYRKAYLRWIDPTTRRPDLRAARIAEVVNLLAAGIKQRRDRGATSQSPGGPAGKRSAGHAAARRHPPGARPPDRARAGAPARSPPRWPRRAGPGGTGVDDERCGRLPVGQSGPGSFPRGSSYPTCVDLQHQEAVATADAVAIPEILGRSAASSATWKLACCRADADERGDREAERRRADVGAVAGDDACSGAGTRSVTAGEDGHLVGERGHGDPGLGGQLVE